jgi:hypothetical protein
MNNSHRNLWILSVLNELFYKVLFEVDWQQTAQNQHNVVSEVIDLNCKVWVEKELKTELYHFFNLFAYDYLISLFS